MNNRLKPIAAAIYSVLFFYTVQEHDVRISTNTDELLHIKNGDYLISVWADESKRAKTPKIDL